MTKYTNTISKQGKIYEIYQTNNPIILYLAKRFQKRIEQLLKSINAMDLNGLDIGCGEGHMLNMLINKKIISNIKGIDLDAERISYSKEKFPHIDVSIMDIYDIDYKSLGEYDYIIATEILEHLPDPIEALEIIKKLLKPESYIIISIPHEPFFQAGNILRGKHWKNKGKTPAHLNFWRKSQFDKLLKSNSFEIIKSYNYTSFPWLIYFCKLDNSGQ